MCSRKTVADDTPMFRIFQLFRSIGCETAVKNCGALEHRQHQLFVIAIIPNRTARSKTGRNGTVLEKTTA
uniref:Uncharacterized protein n=1 Tax=Caenorhabditis japonica TaxID=281687 RepID=A0A8R1I891_CAEJA